MQQVFLSGIAQIQKQVDNLTEQVAQVDMKITEVQEGKFTPKMIDTVKEISKEEAHVRPLDVKLEEFKGILESRDREQIVELEERMKRKHNLMLFHLPEPKTKDKEDRLREESELISKLLSEIKVDHKPVDHRRIGKYVEANNAEDQKHRPVRLTFSSEAMRDDALKAFHRTRKEKLADPLPPKLSATLTERYTNTSRRKKGKKRTSYLKS